MRTLLQMSLTGCYCVPVVLAVRFLLMKVLHSPRRYVYVLWLVVFLNLCLPISLRVQVNSVPEWLKNPAAFLSAETESGKDAVMSEADHDADADYDAVTDDDADAGDSVQAGADVQGYDEAQAGNAAEAAEAEAGAADQSTSLAYSTDSMKEEENNDNRAVNAAIVILSWPGLFGVWLTGLFLVLFYQGIVTFRMHRLLKAGRRVEGKERIYIVHNLSSPCLWGLFRPVICLPEGLEEAERGYILSHERCHKKRGDHIAKWVLFLITAVHWFNPFVWLAYSFCCRDMEISCDEAVLGQAGEDVRKAYAASLLKYAARQNGYLFAPLTFGEPSLRSRVSNILHYRKQGAFVCGAALVIVLLAGAGLFLWAGNSGEGNTEASTENDETMEAIISDDEEAEDYQITGILTGAYGICSYDSSYEDKEFISELLWLAPRRYDVIDGTDYIDVIAGIDSLKESWDETDSYVTYTEDFPVFIRYYMENYVAPDGVNAIDHKDIILLQEGDDMIVCVQRPDEESEWIFYLAPDYGDWLLKEVELRYRICFPELFSETDDSEQERLTAYVQYIMENVADPNYMGYQLIYMDDDSCPEIIVSGQDEATGFLILHYNDGTVYATQSNRLYYSYIPSGNLLLNAEGNMGLYTDDVYSIVDGQVTLIATGYRGLWAMNDGEIEWSGNNLDEDRYFWEGEELGEEEYAAALEAVYPSEQAVECHDIPYYSYREIVALLDESYLKEIPAAKG